MRRNQRRPRDFGAFVEPGGISLVEFRRSGQGIEILKRSAVAESFHGIDEAADRLAELVGASAMPGASLAVAIRGFGVTYEILTLPPGKRPVLRQVVQRELVRMHPDIPDPVTDFARGGRIERRQVPRPDSGVPQQEVLAGMAPRSVIDTLTSALTKRDLRLVHVTVAPSCLARLFEELTADDDPCAVVLAGPTGPLIGFFHEGTLRFFVEPPIAGVEDAETAAAIIADQIRRGSMYLRQQFRGAEVQRVLLAIAAEQSGPMTDRLAGELRISVEPLSSELGEPLGLLALGAVLDSEEEGGLNLYPREDEIAGARRLSNRRSAVLFASAAALLVGAWAAAELLGGVRAAHRLTTLRREAAVAVEEVRPVTGVIAERRANAQRIDALVRLAAERANAPRILRVLEALTADGISLTTLSMTNNDGSWGVSLAGTVAAPSNAAAVRRVDRLYRELPRALAIGGITIDELEYVEDDFLGARFAMTLTDVTMSAAQ